MCDQAEDGQVRGEEDGGGWGQSGALFPGPRAIPLQPARMENSPSLQLPKIPTSKIPTALTKLLLHAAHKPPHAPIRPKPPAPVQRPQRFRLLSQQIQFHPLLLAMQSE